MIVRKNVWQKEEKKLGEKLQRQVREEHEEMMRRELRKGDEQ